MKEALSRLLGFFPAYCPEEAKKATVETFVIDTMFRQFRARSRPLDRLGFRTDGTPLRPQLANNEGMTSYLRERKLC